MYTTECLIQRSVSSGLFQARLAQLMQTLPTLRASRSATKRALTASSCTKCDGRFELSVPIHGHIQCLLLQIVSLLAVPTFFPSSVCPFMSLFSFRLPKSMFLIFWDMCPYLPMSALLQTDCSNHHRSTIGPPTCDASSRTASWEPRSAQWQVTLRPEKDGCSLGRSWKILEDLGQRSLIFLILNSKTTPHSM